MRGLNFDQFVGAHALATYVYNTSGVRFVDDLFPDADPSYRVEKATLWSESPARAIGALDSNNMRRLFQIAVERHGDNAASYADLSLVELKKTELRSVNVAFENETAVWRVEIVDGSSRYFPVRTLETQREAGQFALRLARWLGVPRTVRGARVPESWEAPFEPRETK